MKKNQLKRELGRIRPREELVNSTIAKVNAQKEREERKIFSPIFNKGIRIASALCAICKFMTMNHQCNGHCFLHR